jgi:nucleoside-diphosphate-sugar epimerase
MPEAAVFHQADLLNPAEGRKLIARVAPTHLLHLAWIVKPGELITSIENLDWVVASLNLMRAFHESGGSRFVGVGSCYEYDWEYGYCSEALTPTVPNTLYGASKNAFRELGETYGLAHGLGFAWARLFFLYGPNENPNRLASSVILSLLQGREAKSSHGLQVRDYMHVQDAADGIATLLDSAETGAFNIASGEAIRIRDIVETIGTEIGARELLRIGALPARANDTSLVVADVSKATRQLEFKPQFDLASGMENTVAWWRKQLEEKATHGKGS